MKAIQKELGLMAMAGTPVTKPASRGRPRRLQVKFRQITKKQWQDAILKIEAGEDKEKVFESFQIRPSIIKIAIKPEHVKRLEKVGQRLEGGSTQPDIVRMCVCDFIEKHQKEIAEGKRLVDEPQKRTIVKDRCLYVKVPFPNEVVGAIEKLCVVYNSTRQQVVNRAIEDFLGGL